MNDLSNWLNGLVKTGASAVAVKAQKVEGGSKTILLGAVAPSALVLVVHTTLCRGCGNKWTVPNGKVLGRFDRTITPIKAWSDNFNRLPRERVLRDSQVDTCHMCFEDVSLTRSATQFRDVPH